MEQCPYNAHDCVFPLFSPLTNLTLRLLQILNNLNGIPVTISNIKIPNTTKTKPPINPDTTATQYANNSNGVILYSPLNF